MSEPKVVEVKLPTKRVRGTVICGKVSLFESPL